MKIKKIIKESHEDYYWDKADFDTEKYADRKPKYRDYYEDEDTDDTLDSEIDDIDIDEVWEGGSDEEMDERRLQKDRVKHGWDLNDDYDEVELAVSAMDDDVEL